MGSGVSALCWVPLECLRSMHMRDVWWVQKKHKDVGQGEGGVSTNQRCLCKETEASTKHLRHCFEIKNVWLARTVYVFISKMYDCIFGDFPAKHTVYTPYVCGSVQLWAYGVPYRRHWCRNSNRGGKDSGASNRGNGASTMKLAHGVTIGPAGSHCGGSKCAYD